MVLSVPGRILALGMNLDDPYPEALRGSSNAELEALIALFEPVAPRASTAAAPATGRTFDQRMHYIVHLFRAFHAQQDLFDAPFTPEQVERFLAGVIPDGTPRRTRARTLARRRRSAPARRQATARQRERRAVSYAWGERLERTRTLRLKRLAGFELPGGM